MAPPKTEEEDAAPQSGEENAAAAAAGEKRPASASGETGVAKKEKVPADGPQTFEGGCHCGYIRYEVELDPKNLSTSRCNCTFCQKIGATPFKPKNAAKDFKLISPKSSAEVGDYSPKTAYVESGNADGHRYFCDKCGVHVWNEGWYNYNDQRNDFFGINLATIDQPQEGIDLSDVKITYCDGLHDNWFAEQKTEPWSGGLP